MIDEAPCSYLGPRASSIPLTQQLDNLIVVRGFTKAYSWGGARVGFVVASEAQALRVRELVSPLQVSELSFRAALRLLGFGDIFGSLRERIGVMKPRAADALRDRGLRVRLGHPALPWLVVEDPPECRRTGSPSAGSTACRLAFVRPWKESRQICSNSLCRYQTSGCGCSKRCWRSVTCGREQDQGRSGVLERPHAGGLGDRAMKQLYGRIAIVTGASRGIGKGIAIGLGRAGMTVYVTGRTISHADGSSFGTIVDTAEAIDRVGGAGVPVLCDHRDDRDVRALFERVSTERGRLDILVNNAAAFPELGIRTDVPFWDLPAAVWDEMQAVGVRSHYVASSLAADDDFAGSRLDRERFIDGGHSTHIYRPVRDD